MNRTALITASAVLLAGCGTTSVVETSQSVYTVSAQYGSLNGSWDRAQLEAIAKAKDFCASRKDTYSFISEQRSGVWGYSPQRSQITFSCGPNTPALLQIAAAECKDLYQDSALDAIRSKVELYRDSSESPVPFAIATIDAFPTEDERVAISKWASLREECIKRSNVAFSIPPSSTPIQVTEIQQDRSFVQASAARVGDLVVALYQQKLTYGEFAKKRYEITRDAAEAERQFRLSTQIADQQQRLQAQQLAQQEFQNRLAVWSSYIQAVNARPPQTVVHVEQSVTIH